MAAIPQMTARLCAKSVTSMSLANLGSLVNRASSANHASSTVVVAVTNLREGAKAGVVGAGVTAKIAARAEKVANTRKSPDSQSMKASKSMSAPADAAMMPGLPMRPGMVTAMCPGLKRHSAARLMRELRILLKKKPCGLSAVMKWRRF